MAKVLDLSRQDLQLCRGWSAASKYLIISGVDAPTVFKRLKAAVEADAPAVDASLAAQADPAGEFGPQLTASAGAASYQARQAWDMSEEIDELAPAPTKKEQTYIK